MRLASAFDLVSARDRIEVGRLARMRRFFATSSGHELITDTSLRCAHRNGLDPIVCRGQVRVRVLARDCSPERPLLADARTAQPGELYGRSAAHAGCSGVRSWIAPGRAPPVACACAFPWGPCESDPIGRTARSGFRLQPVVVLRVRPAHVPSLGARVRYQCGRDRGGTVRRFAQCCVIGAARPSTRCARARPRLRRNPRPAVRMHAARAKACVHLRHRISVRVWVSACACAM
jgi:hypothetical protein